MRKPYQDIRCSQINYRNRYAILSTRYICWEVRQNGSFHTAIFEISVLYNFLWWHHCIQLLKIHIISNIHLPIFSTHYLVPEYQWIPQIELISYSFSRNSVRWNFLWKKVAAPNLFNATPFIFICNLENPLKINVPTYAALDTCVRHACLPFCETPGRASRCTDWYLLT